MLTTLFLHGKPGHLFARQYKLDVNTPAEALRAMFRLVPGFKKYLRDAESQGTTFRVYVDGKPVSFHERLLATFSAEMHLYPIVIGSKRQGILQTIIGAVLIIVGAVLIYTGYGAAIGKIFVAAGIAMMAGGVVQMLSNPRMPQTQSTEEMKRGYLFNGGAMSSKQGAAVPVGYGKLHIGPIVISAGMFSERYTEPYNTESAGGAFYQPPNNSTGGGGSDMSNDTPPPYTYNNGAPYDSGGQPFIPQNPNLPQSPNYGTVYPTGYTDEISSNSAPHSNIDYWWRNTLV